MAGVGRHVVEHGGQVEVAAAVRGAAAGDHLAAVAGRLGDQGGDLAPGVLVDQRAEVGALLQARADGQRSPAGPRTSRRTRRPPARGRRTGWPRCRPRRRCASWPGIAPSTAASRSASSKTRNGALPPSSIEQLVTVSAAVFSSTRPTSVDPVKDSLRTRGSASIADDHGPGGLVDDHVDHAVGHAGLAQDVGDGERGQRRLLGRLEHDRAAGRQRRADLAGGHGGREVPRRDQHADADRLLQHQDPVGPRRARSPPSRRSGPPPRRTSGRTRPRR